MITVIGDNFLSGKANPDNHSGFFFLKPAEKSILLLLFIGSMIFILLDKSL
jgi:hypothetical protein